MSEDLDTSLEHGAGTAITSPAARAHGFTLVEVMVAASILIVGLLGTFSMVDQAQRTTQANASRTATLNLAREILEQARTLEYTELTPALLIAQLRTRPNLGGTLDASGRWRIVRRGVAITVEASVCTFDDPTNGLSPVPPQNACAGAMAITSAVAQTSNPDDFRRISLTMIWQVRGQTHRTVQTAQINNPSGGTGPKITNLPDPFALQVITGDNIPFVVSSTPSTTVRWSMDDGISTGEASGGPTGWGFNWNIGTVGNGSWTVDGTYTASVQPFDSRGVPGEKRAATVLLNRRVPLAPQNLAGGRSDAGGGVVELEWTASPERDILGYRVYRTGSTNIRTRVCPAPAAGTDGVSTKLSCTDPDPGPAPQYTVVAVDRPTLGTPSSGTREGDATTLVVGDVGVRPGEPRGVTAEALNGRVTLTWQPGDGPAPVFYRIYRDGVRVDRTATDLPTFTDPIALDGDVHRYRVTAVSEQFNESEHSQEVTAQ